MLIHAGTGGVGQAAVEVCSALGAAITATAGSAQKRTFLRAAGIATAAGSRDASFVDVIACRGRTTPFHLMNPGHRSLLQYDVHCRNPEPKDGFHQQAVMQRSKSMCTTTVRIAMLALLASWTRQIIVLHDLFPLMHAGPIDVALNSLTSPGMVAATLAGMAHSGRVTEISKRDIWSPERVAQERPDIRYNIIAVDFLPGQVWTLPWDPPVDPPPPPPPCQSHRWLHRLSSAEI